MGKKIYHWQNNQEMQLFSPCPKPNYGADFKRTISTNIYMPTVWFEQPVFLLRPETTKHQSYCVSGQEVVLECVAQKLMLLAANIWINAVTLPAVRALTQVHTQLQCHCEVLKLDPKSINLLRSRSLGCWKSVTWPRTPLVRTRKGI